jgi:hypothetical protein
MGGTMSDETSETVDSGPPLAPGDRVRMSALGLARHPKYASHKGVVVGKVSASGLRVKFDERKQLQTIHHSYLVRVAES